MYILTLIHSDLIIWAATVILVIQDPNQNKNVSDEYPEIVKLMEERLQLWLKTNMDKSGRTKDPMQEIIDSGGPFRYMEPTQWIERLERAGWNEHALQLKTKYILK